MHSGIPIEMAIIHLNHIGNSFIGRNHLLQSVWTFDRHFKVLIYHELLLH